MLKKANILKSFTFVKHLTIKKILIRAYTLF